ncbi:YybH family protein [Nocardioides sp. Kera G14]|uniref:YybH family protein n=1 Tax=Nocardioides sp. Kera G14 TaxID=2884264 RepID=UPI001D112F65|nr:nuclear transport factor 2 family protein [Nocardioides sp. Kera G14]UDY24576.1 nuclear transport factor 2 family protein [Nocardioides sp. Kera G14]
MSTETEVLEAADRLVEAFGRHDAAAYFACFDADADFIFYNHPQRLDSRSAWEQLWRQWESEDGFRVLGCRSTDRSVHVVDERTAIFTHAVETDVSLGGETSTSRERETIVFHRGDAGWVAVHEHLSPTEA